MDFFIGIIGLASLVTFFVMAVALVIISRAVRNTNRIVSAWSKETGIGLRFKCKQCKRTFEGRQPFCPFCGAEQRYS
jgi:hypothetical protein